MPKLAFTIDRSKWVCGGKRNHGRLGYSSLLNERGRMCCLGQILRACGIEKSELDGAHCPTCLLSYRGFLVQVNRDGGASQTRLSAIAMSLNDNAVIPQSDREAKLRGLFAEYGIDLSFSGRLFP